MGELGHGRTQGLVDHDLTRGVGEVVVAADDVRDAHGGVVHHGGEVVGGRAVRADDHEVVELLGVKHHVSVHGVVDVDVAAVLGHLDAQHVGLAGVHARTGLGGVDVTATALVALEGVLAGTGRLAVGLELLRRAEAGVGAALGEQALGGGMVDVETLHLLVGAERAADVGTLVPVEPEPLHGAKDYLGVLLGGAGRVGVVDSQDEGAVVRAGEGPVVDRGARAADVQLARGRGREADADGTVG